MAREINAELLDTKIEKAQQDLVKAKHRYDAAAATLKDLLDKRDALRQKKLLDAIAQSGRSYEEIMQYLHSNTGGATAEAQIVEMPDGSLKTYLRTGSGYIAEVTSIDGGETWSDRVPLTEIATTSYGTQLSVINYSQPIDGKPAIILSAPNATNGRKNGKIWIGLINETGQSGVNKYSVEWKYCYSVDTPQMGYSYSCLTELPDGKVGLLYEKYDSWSRNELHLKNILKYEKFTIDELKVQP